MNKQLHQALVSHLLNNVDDDDIITLYNEHASDEDYVYNSIAEIVELINADDDPVKVAGMVYFGNVQSWNDHFFYLNGYGNIDSFSNLTGALSPIDFDLLARQVIENEQFADVNFDAEPYLSDDE